MAQVGNIHEMITRKPLLLYQDRKPYKGKAAVTIYWIDEQRNLAISPGKWIADLLNPEGEKSGYLYTDLGSPFNQCTLLLPYGKQIGKVADDISRAVFGEPGRITMIDLGYV